MRRKPDFEKVRQRLLAFWQGEIVDRACIAVTAPKTPDVSAGDRDKARGTESLRAYWSDPETIRRAFLEKMERTYLGGDAMPILMPNFGTSGHCNYYGATPVYDWETIWFEPALEDLSPARLVYRPEIVDRHLKIIEYLAARAEGEYLVGMTDSCGTLDALAHLYGSEKLLIAMLEEPDTVARAVHIVNGGWADCN